MLRVTGTEITVVAEKARFSARAEFGEGLGVIRAENNMGKTTLLMSILYGMGLEGMLGPGDQRPLKPAVRSEIRDEDGGTHGVVESWVLVELENGEGARLTLQRPIVSLGESANLVHSWAGPALTQPGGEYAARDYFVRMPGAAQREAGLHHQLARFIGWDLPEVTSWAGNSVPLYMEILFSMLFVEQTRGWSAIAAVIPKYLQVRDPDRRAVEFLCGLQALTRASDREALNLELSELKADWRAATEGFRARVTEIGGLLEGLPSDPPTVWPPPVSPSVRVLRDQSWTGLAEGLAAMRSELRELTVELPRVEDVAEQTAQQLRAAEDRLARLAGLVAAAARDLREQQGELDALDERILAIEEDRSRYADAIRLASLGSIQQLAVATTRCPTCDQHLPHTLLGDQLRPVMSLEDNKELLDQERTTFLAMRHDAATVAVSGRQRLRALRHELDDARSDVRSLKATLVQNAHAPSRAVIERQVRLEQRIEQFQALEQSVAGLDEVLTPLAQRHLRLRAALARLSGSGVSSHDQERLEALGSSVRSQLHEYGFSSIPPSEITLAPDSYLPQRQGDRPLLAKDISASDNVRLVWAYLVGMLELGRVFDTPHPGFVVFDEPGQQDISDDSLAALFARLASTAASGQQAIVATSKPEAELTVLLRGHDASRSDFDGHTLQR